MNQRVELVDVDDDVLAELVEVATTDAAGDEVTPPLTDGPQWTPARIAWLQEFHRAHRDGLDGQSGHAVWAVVVDGAVVGQVRLQRQQGNGDGDEAEIGMWLRRNVRGRGVGSAVVRAVVERAAAAGLRRVIAETPTTNVASRRTLERAGFTVTPGGQRGLLAHLDLA